MSEINIGTVIVKLASRCNLDCSYCYVYNHEDQRWKSRPAEISNEVYDALLLRVGDYYRATGRPVGLTYHGGEPTLVGPDRMDELAGRAREVLGDGLHSLMMQTNATLIDDQFAKVLAKHSIRVGVSLDGPAALHDSTRLDHAGRGSHAGTVRGLETLRRASVDTGVITVVTPGADGGEVYRYLRGLDVTGIHMQLPVVSHDNKDKFYSGLGDTPVADFLIPAFDAYIEEDNPSVKVTTFWGLLRAALGGGAWKDDFGNPALAYLVVETDGDIEALDLLRVCAEGAGRCDLNVLTDGFDRLMSNENLLRDALTVGFPLPSFCSDCPESHTCAGGYPPSRFSRADGFNNPSVWCQDIFLLIQHMRKTLNLPISDQTTIHFDRILNSAARRVTKRRPLAVVR